MALISPDARSAHLRALPRVGPWRRALHGPYHPTLTIRSEEPADSSRPLHRSVSVSHLGKRRVRRPHWRPLPFGSFEFVSLSWSRLSESNRRPIHYERSTSFRTALPSEYWRLSRLQLHVAAAGGSLRCPVIHRAAAMPVYRRAARPLPPRSQRRGDRTLDGVLEIVNRVHRPPGPLDGLRCHRSLHRPTRMHGTADAARTEEPSQEAYAITVQARNAREQPA
jgi:hypothetical protein